MEQLKPTRYVPETSEGRAALFAEAIRHTAAMEEPVHGITLCGHLREWAGLREEQSAADIYQVVFLLVRSGLYGTNTGDFDRGEIYLGKDTYLIPSQTLMKYIHCDPEGEQDQVA